MSVEASSRLRAPRGAGRVVPIIYRFEFGLDAAGMRFLPGHRIRVEVMSSWSPRYERNTNRGAANNFLDDHIVKANQRVFHESGRASFVTLPVARRQ